MKPLKFKEIATERILDYETMCKTRILCYLTS